MNISKFPLKSFLLVTMLTGTNSWAVSDAEIDSSPADTDPQESVSSVRADSAATPTGEEKAAATSVADSEDEEQPLQEEAEESPKQTVAETPAPEAPNQNIPEAAENTVKKPQVATDTSHTPPPADTPDKARQTTAVATTKQQDLSEIIALLKQQQKELSEQKSILKAQSEKLDAQASKLEQQDLKITTLTQELDVLRAPAPTMTEEVLAAKPDKEQKATLAATPGESEKGEELTSAEQKAEKKTETGETIAAAQADDPTRALLEQFKGAWRLPGTSAALSVGGHVKASMVYNFDPLEIKDRFIVGSIPVGVVAEADAEAQSSLTASQSRLNFDLREPTEFGIMRAFIEADFAGENDTFRLRHAFGQWHKLLAGKTWSAFVDTSASPEEVDFEGLNGRVNVRQSQFRFMPTIGEDYEFQLSLEDPNPQITDGQGVTKTPDLVLSGRFQLQERLHIKASFLARQIRGKADFGDGGVEKDTGLGLSISGRFNIPRYDKRDVLLFQLNTGDGIGRYINDLSSVGNFDGIFNPKSGNLELYKVTSGYASLQHWWGGDQLLRSNFTFGFVSVDNPGFLEGDAYKQTIRFSSNVFWSPMPRIDIGAEWLWGRRENEDGHDGDAQQIQLGLRYRF